MRAETRRTAIPSGVKAAAAARDGGVCVICGAPGAPCCHVVRRSQGGRGDTERNIVTLCGACHKAFDEGTNIRRLLPLGFHSREDIREFIYDYMADRYTGWTPESVTYHKHD